MPRQRSDREFRSILCAIDFSAHAAREELRRFVTRTIRAAGAREPHYLTALGRPAPEVLAAAKRQRADLIVLGTQGLTGVSKVLFGSTTDQVLRKSTIPVLAIPAAAAAPHRSWPRRVVAVVLALDGSARHEIRTVRSLATTLHAQLLVVHPMAEIRMPPWIGGDSRPYTTERMLDARKQLKALCAKSADAPAACRIVVGDPAETVAALAARERADLLVLPLRKSAGLLRGRTRANAYRILCAARRPVLAWPLAGSHPRPGR